MDTHRTKHPRDDVAADEDADDELQAALTLSYERNPVEDAASLSVPLVMIGAVQDRERVLGERLQSMETRGELRVTRDDLAKLCLFRRSFTAEELQLIGNWVDTVGTVVENHVAGQSRKPLWEDRNSGKCSVGETHRNSAPFVCFRLKLAQALVLNRIRSPPDNFTCCSAYSAAKAAIRFGRIEAIRQLLACAPTLLDCEINPGLYSAQREQGAYDCELIFVACETQGLPAAVRLEMVHALLSAVRARARQQGAKPPLFHCLSRAWARTPEGGIDQQPSFEYRALQAAIVNGHDSCARALRDAGVPIDASAYSSDPQERKMIECILRGDHSSAQAIARDASKAQLDRMNVITPEARDAAMKLFGGNHPMATGYLVGKLGLEARAPPNGWASLDPDGAKAKALRDALQTEAQLRNYQSRLLHTEMQLLRAALQSEENEAVCVREHMAGGSALLVFACNPDRERAGVRLKHTLDEAVGVSRCVAAHIFGGTDLGCDSKETRLDRECTLSALQSELEERRRSQQAPWGFLFAGHADAIDGVGAKTLGFTSDGRLAPFEGSQQAKLARLLAEHARGVNGGALELVFLSGCDSLDLAQAIKKENAALCVVCWETKVIDEAAYLFSRGFFRALRDQDRRLGYNYLAAFEAAQTALESKRRPMPEGEEVPYFIIAPPQDGLIGNSYAAGVPKLL